MHAVLASCEQKAKEGYCTTVYVSFIKIYIIYEFLDIWDMATKSCMCKSEWDSCGSVQFSGSSCKHRNECKMRVLTVVSNVPSCCISQHIS